MRKYYLSENLDFVLNILLLVFTLVCNTIGFLFSKPHNNPTSMQMLCHIITGTGLMINTLLLTTSIILKKYKIIELIVTLFSGFILFPTIVLTSKYPSETINYEFVIPVLYSIISFRRTIILFIISTLNMLLLGCVNYFQMLKMGDIKASHVPMIVYSFSAIYMVITIVALIIAESTRELLDKEKIIQEQYKDIARKDPLTGLYNRFGLNEKIKKEEAIAIMLDIDHFKHVNDTFGHQIGDSILISIADILKKFANNNFLVSRFGGEEFLIVSFYSKKETVALCEKIRNNIKTKVLKPNKENVTVSIGVSNIGIFGESLIKEADDCLYYSKENGRDKITIA